MQLDRKMFNAVPIPAFVVNGDLQLLDLNDAAVQFCGQKRNDVLGVHAGKVLGCKHSMDAPEGCGGSEACSVCVVRTSVTSCLRWQSVRRHKVTLELAQQLAIKDFQVLINISPLQNGAENVALLMIEDISEFGTLNNQLHFCLHCRNVRSEKQHWADVREYLHEHAGVAISLGVCPACDER